MGTNANNQERNGRQDEIPKHYSTAYGYANVGEEPPMNPYVNNQCAMQNMGQEQIPAEYADQMERQYVYNYPMYEGGIPVNASIQGYRQHSYQMLNPYEPLRPGTRVMYSMTPDYLDRQGYQTVAVPNGKATHRQKKNFFCC